MANQVEVNLKLKADRSAARQTENAIDGVNDALQQVEAQTRRNEKALSSLEKVQRDVFDAQLRSAKQQSELFGDVGSRVSAFSGLASGLGGGGLGGQMMIGADILDAVEAMKLMKTELPELGRQLTSSGKLTTGMVGALQAYVPGMSTAQAQTVAMVGSLAAMAAAAGGLIVAFKLANDIIKESGELTGRWVDANKKYAETITGTTEEVNAAIKANEERNVTLEKERERLQAFIDEADKASGVEGALLDVNKALGLNMGGYKDVKNALEEVNREIDVNTGINKQLTQALAEGATAAADAAEAEKALSAEREQAVTKRVKVMLDAENLIATGTEEQVQARIDQIQREVEVYQRYGGDLEQYQDLIYDLSQETLVLTQRVLPLVQAREAETAAAEKQRETLDALKESRVASLDAMKAEAEQRMMVLDAFESMQTGLDALATSFEEKRVAENEAYEQRLTDLSADYRQQRTDALREFEQESAEIEEDWLADRANEVADFYAERQEKIDDFNREELKRLDQYHVDRQRAEEDHRYALEDAAARLDTVGVLQEMRNYNTQERRRTEDFNRETAQRQQQFDAQLDQERQAFDRRLQQEDESYKRSENRRLQHFQQQLAADENAYRQQTAKLQQQHQRTLTELQTQYNREKGARETAFNQQIRQLQGFNQQELLLRAKHYADLQRQMDTYFRQQAISNIGSTPRPITSGGTGGSSGRTIAPIGTSNSTITNNSRSSNSAVTINVDGSGNPEATGMAVRQELARFFREAAR